MQSTATIFVFVDFENIPKVDLGLVEGQPVHVTLLIGAKQTKADWDLTEQIRRFSSQVTLRRIGASGHNALDLTLSYYLGQAVERASNGQFIIVSKDKDFEPLMAHLKANGVRIERCDSFATLPFVAPPKRTGLSRPPFAPKPPPKVAISSKPDKAAAKFEKFIQHLRNSPPSNKTKLEHMIEAYFKPSLPAGGKKGIIAELIKRAVIAIDSAGKVTVL